MSNSQQIEISKELVDLFQNGSEEDKIKYATSVIDMISGVVSQYGLNGFRSIKAMLQDPQKSADFWFVVLQTMKSEYQEKWFNFLMTALNTKII